MTMAWWMYLIVIGGVVLVEIVMFTVMMLVRYVFEPFDRWLSRLDKESTDAHN